jgi:DNA polymerase I-like protein with 3'-5' exonuclease and polymerase domains
MGARGLQSYAQDTYGVEMSMQQAEQFRQRFFQAYRGIERWHKRVREEMPKKDERACLPRRALSPQTLYMVRSSRGSRFVQYAGARQCGRYHQKSIRLDHGRKSESQVHLIACVHDEILMEVPEEQKVEAQYFLQRQMERAGKAILRSVPVVAESNIGHSWAEAK